MYLLTLIRCRKSNWLHVGSIPTIPTKNASVAEWTKAIVSKTIERKLRGGSNPSWRAILRISVMVARVTLDDLVLVRIQYPQLKNVLFLLKIFRNLLYLYCNKIKFFENIGVWCNGNTSDLYRIIH